MDHKQEVQRLRVLLLEAWSRPLSEKLDMSTIANITQQLTSALWASGGPVPYLEVRRQAINKYAQHYRHYGDEALRIARLFDSSSRSRKYATVACYVVLKGQPGVTAKVCALITQNQGASSSTLLSCIGTKNQPHWWYDGKFKRIVRGLRAYHDSRRTSGHQSIDSDRVRELWQAGYTAAEIGMILGKEDGRLAYQAGSIQLVVIRLRQDELVDYRRRVNGA